MDNYGRRCISLRNPQPTGERRAPLFELLVSETPSSKPQAPEKFQISNTKPQKQMPGQTARTAALSFPKIEMPAVQLPFLSSLTVVAVFRPETACSAFPR